MKPYKTFAEKSRALEFIIITYLIGVITRYNFCSFLTDKNTAPHWLVDVEILKNAMSCDFLVLSGKQNKTVRVHGSKGGYNMWENFDEIPTTNF